MKTSSSFSGPASAMPYPAILLLSGTILATLAQHIVSLNTSSPAAHFIPFTKYVCALLVSVSMSMAGKGASKSRVIDPKNARHAELLALSAGIMDTVAYTLNALGFPSIGSALSMVVFAAAGQLFTAAARVLLLNKKMSNRQVLAVAIVTLGVAIRSLGAGTAKSTAVADQKIATGIAFTVASAALYSLLGVTYERLITMKGNPLSHTQINLRMASTGFVALLLYQICYTLPRRDELILQPLEQSGLDVGYVVLLHILFGVWFAGHSLVQGRVLEKSGAMSVGIVNALRAATVSAVSAVLYCSPAAPQQCMNYKKGASTFVISVGALLWATSPPLPSAMEKKD